MAACGVLPVAAIVPVSGGLTPSGAIKGPLYQPGDIAVGRVFFLLDRRHFWSGGGVGGARYRFLLMPEFWSTLSYRFGTAPAFLETSYLEIVWGVCSVVKGGDNCCHPDVRLCRLFFFNHLWFDLSLQCVGSTMG